MCATMLNIPSLVRYRVSVIMLTKAVLELMKQGVEGSKNNIKMTRFSKPPGLNQAKKRKRQSNSKLKTGSLAIFVDPRKGQSTNLDTAQVNESTKSASVPAIPLPQVVGAEANDRPGRKLSCRKAVEVREDAEVEEKEQQEAEWNGYYAPN